MAVRTKTLVAEAEAPGFTTPYTVPADHTTIVKDIRIHGTNTAGPGAITVYAGLLSGPAIDVAQMPLVAGAQSRFGLSTFLVLRPGDSLFVLTSGTGATGTVWISGAELSGVAE